jgi:hypothetical protein
MRFFILTITLFVSKVTFTQNIDTSFIIQTQQSEIRIICLKIFENSNVSQSTLLLQVFIKMSESAIEEAINIGVKEDEFVASLSYDQDCNLISMTSFTPSRNKNFNQQIEEYFNEFINAYRTHNLKMYFAESETDCGIEKLSISYHVL